MMFKPTMAAKQHRRNRCRLVEGFQAAPELVELVAPADDRGCMIGWHDGPSASIETAT